MSIRAVQYAGMLGSVLALQACAGPARLEPVPQIASREWSAPEAGSDPGYEDETDLPTLLGSPALADLIERAQASSPTLLAASARIDQARALVRLARGASMPALSIGTGATATGNASGKQFDFSSNFATIDAALSFDLAGGAAAGKRSAAQRVEAARLDRGALLIALTAEIARTYVARAALKARLDLIDRNIAQATDLQRVIGLRKREGVATQVDVGLQVIRVQQLRAERERLEQSFGETRVALALLVGDEAPNFTAVPADIRAFAVPEIAPPLPAQLMRRRPDVLAAEARIFAAGGDVKQARAAFFPRLNLSVSRSAQSFLSGGVFSGMTIGAELLAPIFDRNRLRGNLALASAQQRESVENYRLTLLTALADVENGLSAAQHARSRAAILDTVVAEARRTADLARRQYLEGDADLRHVLDAQDLLISAEDACMISRQERLEAAIVLFRVTRG